MKKVFLVIICVLFLISVCIINNVDIVMASNNAGDEISSKSYILIDMESNESLVESDAHNKMPVASICKLMTALITLEKIDNKIIDLNDMAKASDYACSMEGSQAFLDSGAEYKIYDLLKSVIVASANDSSVVLAEYISGSENQFVNIMNQRANELGMNNTFYENANGLPTPNQYSTAYDTAIILREISKYNLYNEFSNIWMDTLVHPSGRETELVNTNRLIKYYDYCLNGKTGYTDEAGYCLASSATNGELTLIAVVLNGENPAARFSDSIKLYNYGFANFENRKILNANHVVDNIKIIGGNRSSVDIAIEKDCYVLSKKGDNSNVDIKYNYENVIKAPIVKNDILGHVEIIKSGKVIKTINIVATNNVDKHNLSDIFDKIVNNWNLI